MAHWRQKLYEIIFRADTPAGKAFDIALLIAILLSVVAVMLESVQPIRAEHGDLLLAAEWLFTAIFTVEYVLRLVCSPQPLRYARSFFGIIDLLAILPSYLSLVGLGAHHHTAMVLRSLRLLRVFRVFNMGQVVGEANALGRAIVASRNRILVFLVVVLSIVLILGAAMFLVENGENGFSSIPQSMYWAIVTMTTVGYGDIAPQTIVGKLIAAVMMILGYSLIIVPTGIISAEVVSVNAQDPRTCPTCSRYGHHRDAKYCRHCGAPL